jgi:hypothetical protein
VRGVKRDGEWRLLTRSLTENYDPRERYGPATEPA